MTEEELMKLRKLESDLEGHPTPVYTSSKSIFVLMLSYIFVRHFF